MFYRKNKDHSIEYIYRSLNCRYISITLTTPPDIDEGLLSIMQK